MATGALWCSDNREDLNAEESLVIVSGSGQASEEMLVQYHLPLLQRAVKCCRCQTCAVYAEAI